MKSDGSVQAQPPPNRETRVYSGARDACKNAAQIARLCANIESHACSAGLPRNTASRSTW